MMTDNEGEAAAAELAKAGGLSWHSGEERGPLKLVMDRYRNRARVALAALERLRAAKHANSPDPIDIEQVSQDLQANLDLASHEKVAVGSMVLYRPPGDKRAYPCRVQRTDGSRVFLVPEIPTCTGWVDIAPLSLSAIH
ncbi:hypothetical protein [Microvirga sp. VF16]|uniref:hypothetical protein n=1 Tax=Microvirga sp. VF16 TaxID=2807101 RepID=UPI00193D69AC|nr:hypothetical protein [Microvirga sp. VF16]QRM32424.1 hypothetical protein JO965_30435 [Microvirga sp. VF16]